MSIRTPEPRLPLEPEEYPLYQPPRRVGCSAITIITLATVAVFFLLLWRVTPQLARNITDFPKSLPVVGGIFSGGSSDNSDAGGDTTGDNATPGTGGFPTQTALGGQTNGTPAAASPTNTPAPTPAPTNTPVPKYVKVVNTGGRGVSLRKEPTQTAEPNGVAEEGAILKIIGEDVPDASNPKTIWRKAEYLKNGTAIQGYVRGDFLTPVPAPTP
jgi:hypothetical protein